jgi:hypothetical protein
MYFNYKWLVACCHFLCLFDIFLTLPVAILDTYDEAGAWVMTCTADLRSTGGFHDVAMVIFAWIRWS